MSPLMTPIETSSLKVLIEILEISSPDENFRAECTFYYIDVFVNWNTIQIDIVFVVSYPVKGTVGRNGTNLYTPIVSVHQFLSPFTPSMALSRNVKLNTLKPLFSLELTRSPVTRT